MDRKIQATILCRVLVCFHVVSEERIWIVQHAEYMDLQLDFII